MATIIIGSARHDENGKYTSGAAGDQLQTSSTNDKAGEVSMQNMYTHSKGWYILRPKSVSNASAIASKMQAACNNANIGYDQGNRLGIITYGISTTTKTECDCSSLVRECVKEATGTDPGNFTTSNEATKLAATGLFEDKIAYVSQAKTPVYNGDILVTKTKGHTVIVVSGNARSSSSSSKATQSITATVKAIQTWLNTYYSAGLTVDNAYGSKTKKALIKAWQTEVGGLTVDGIFGTKSKTKAASTVIKSGSSGLIVTIWQAFLVCKGYSISIDGDFGGKTTTATKQYQKANSLTQDGQVGKNTWTKAFA